MGLPAVQATQVDVSPQPLITDHRSVRLHLETIMTEAHCLQMSLKSNLTNQMEQSAHFTSTHDKLYIFEFTCIPHVTMLPLMSVFSLANHKPFQSNTAAQLQANYPLLS